MVTPSTNLQTDASSRTDVFVNNIGPAAGYEVAKGASVNLDVVSIHHDATVFSDPERFDPDRFDVSRAPPSQAGRLFFRRAAIYS